MKSRVYIKNTFFWCTNFFAQLGTTERVNMPVNIPVIGTAHVKRKKEQSRQRWSSDFDLDLRLRAVYQTQALETYSSTFPFPPTNVLQGVTQTLCLTLSKHPLKHMWEGEGSRAAHSQLLILGLVHPSFKGTGQGFH